MGFLTNLFTQLSQQQSAPAPAPAPTPTTQTYSGGLRGLFSALGQQTSTIDPNHVASPPLTSTPIAPQQPFTPSTLSWQDQLANAMDWQGSSGSAWETIGKDGVFDYMGNELFERYGTRNLSDFRYMESPGTPGNYYLDWNGRNASPTSLKDALKLGALSSGWITGAPASDSSDGSGATLGNAADNLSFGATWEGDGGTTFNFYRKPDGSVGIRTGAAQSNDTGDIISALGVLAGGVMAGGGLGAVGTSANVGASAAGGAAATMGAAGAQGVLPASYFAGAGAAGMGAGAAAAGTGAVDLGGGIGMTPDGGITGAMTSAESGLGTISNAGIEQMISGAGLEAAMGGAASSAIPSPQTGAPVGQGTPPPANPYHPGSYLDPSNIGNLIQNKVSNMSLLDIARLGSSLFGGGGSGGGARPGGTGGGAGTGAGGVGGLQDLFGLINGAVSANRQGKAADEMKAWLLSQQGKMEGYMNPNSPEYNQMWQEMSRKDAAAGRNSQYGPRTSDFLANVAKAKADNTLRFTTGTSKAYADALNQNASKYAGLSSEIGRAFSGSGGTMNLSSLLNTLNGSSPGGSGGISNDAFWQLLGSEGSPIDYGAGMGDPTEADVWDSILNDDSFWDFDNLGLEF